MTLLEHNEQAERYQALEGGHFIAIEEDVFMIQLERLQSEEEMSEVEALNEVFDVQWWYDHLPLYGVFIDGIEQNDLPEMHLCKTCGQHHPIGAGEWYCPLDPNKVN